MTPTSQHDIEILIIGAGMAGLSAARELQRTGRRVLVLDKGRVSFPVKRTVHNETNRGW